MAHLIVYKALIEDIEKKNIFIEKKVADTTLSKAIFSCQELHGIEVIVSVNNNAIIPADDWHKFQLIDSDEIIIFADIEGRGTLPIIGAIVGATIGFFTGGTGWALAAAIFKGALIGYSIGSIADSLLYPPTLPSIPAITGGDFSSDDPNYSWSGPMLVTKPDGPVSISYGENRIGGTLIMQYISTEPDKTYLNILICLGEGKINGIVKEDLSGICSSPSDIPAVLINGQKFSSYGGITWDYRLGENNQSPIQGFHNTSTTFSDGRKITTSTPLIYTTTDDIEEFEIQLSCPNIYIQDNQGNISNNTIKYRLEYKLTSSGTYTLDGEYTISGKSKTVFFSFKKVSNLTLGRYDIRITRLTPEFTSFLQSGDLYLSNVTETIYENIAYVNSALIAFKIQATDQLSGGIPNITTLIRGIEVDVPRLEIFSVVQNYEDCYWDNTEQVYKRISDDVICTETGNLITQWSRNPVWCVRDFLINKRYGLGNYSDAINFNEISAILESRYCWEMVDDLNSGLEHRFKIDICLSQFTSAIEAKKLFASTFRGWIISTENKEKIVIDRPADPVQLFDMSNIDPQSLQVSYFRESEIVNFLEAQYVDPIRDYNLHVEEIVDYNDWTDLKPIRKATMNMRGKTRTSEVLRNGRFFLNSSKFSRKAIKFNADQDAIHCEPGDTILFQHDSLGWGIGGRIVGSTSSSITTNIDITYSAGYKVRVRLPYGGLELKDVISITDNNRVINISGTFSATIQEDSIFTYGPLNSDAKPFKAVNIAIEDDHKLSVEAIEESESRYNDTSNLYLPSANEFSTLLPDPISPPQNITDLVLTELTNRPGFLISFNIPKSDPIFSHADIQLSLDGINYWTHRSGIVANSDIEIIGTLPGQTYYVKVISYNGVGIANLSPVVGQITIKDINFVPPDINGLRLDGEESLTTTEFTKKDAKFVWVKNSLTSGAGNIPAGEEPLGAGQWIDDVYYKYWIEIRFGTLILRREILSDNFYVYTFEKNVGDNNGTPTNTFTIYVWGYNEAAGIKSVNPAILTVSNPAPDSPSNLQSDPWMRAVEFSWNSNTEIDFLKYTYRKKIESSAWSSWFDITSTSILITLTDSEIDLYGADAEIFFEIRAHDTFGNISTVSDISDTVLSINIKSTDIDDFAITASKIFTKIPILEGDSWSNNTPSSGYVTWNTHKLFYNGVEYNIITNNTNQKYIYWLNGNNFYSSSDTNPVLNDDDFIIATNINGYYDLAWNAIANQVIGSAYIQDAAIVEAKIQDLAVTTAKINYLAVDTAQINDLSVTDAKIANLAVTNAKIANLAVTNAKIANLAVTEAKIANLAVTNAKIGNLAVTTGKIGALQVTNAKIATLDAAKINTGYLSADRIQASSITAGKISVSSLSSLSANLGTITAGTITLPSTGWIRGGQTDYATGTGFFLGYSSGAYKFSFGNTSQYIRWDGSNLYIGGQVVGQDNIANYIQGTKTIVYSPDIITVNTAGWFRVKEFMIARSGTITVSTFAGNGTASGIGLLRYLLNGSTIGITQNIITGSGYLEYTQNLTVSAGSQLSLEVNKNTVPNVIYYRDTRIKVSNPDASCVIKHIPDTYF